MHGRVLVIAGSDSGGGAGIQADIKTITCLGGYAMTAITALTAQNSLGVHGIHPVPNDFLRQQIQVTLTDFGADAIKIGMLATASVIETVAQALEDFAPTVPLVLDTVMVAKGGHPLLEGSAVAALCQHLIPRATVITPNLPEASVLLGRPLTTLADMEQAIEDFSRWPLAAVLLKGGHLDGDALTDLLWQRPSPSQAPSQTLPQTLRFDSPRLPGPHTHGTGCSLASAIACGIAQGLSLSAAVARGRDYVRLAIAAAPGFGHGHGPLNHAVTVSHPLASS